MPPGPGRSAGAGTRLDRPRESTARDAAAPSGSPNVARHGASRAAVLPICDRGRAARDVHLVQGVARRRRRQWTERGWTRRRHDAGAAHDHLGQLARIAATVQVGVGLERVRDVLAVVAGVADAVAVAVALGAVARGRAVVAGIADAVAVAVGLARIGDARADVAGVAGAIAIGVLLTGVRRRRAIVADVAGAVAFLVSADGSYVNGQNLSVDGGYSLKYVSRRRAAGAE